ncbi:MAG: hypothetical protein OYG31_00815 [Candidatus Kaiserbacteria bacterium]|nr:hypothetical protein [Candidatus Kaiserbacteria bacterium]
MEEEPAVNQAPTRRAMNELLRLTRENNRILRAERNLRRLKGIAVLLVLLGSTGYGYHLFNRYQSEVVATVNQLNELRGQVETVVDEVGQIADTAKGLTDILGGDGE